MRRFEKEGALCVAPLVKRDSASVVEQENAIAMCSVVCGRTCVYHRVRLDHGGGGASALRRDICFFFDHRRPPPCALDGDDRGPFDDYFGQRGCGTTVF